MPFAQKLLCLFPTWLVGVIFVAAALIPAVAGLLVVRRLIPHSKLKLHNDVAGFIFATLGVVYAVLLAFTVIIVWENYDKSRGVVEQETGYLVDLYRDSTAFPPQLKTQIQGKIVDYLQVTINQEWQEMEKGNSSPAAEAALTDLWNIYSSYSPQNQKEIAFYQESIGKLNNISELRISRLLQSRLGINSLLWFVLILGGAVTIIFTWFFGTENFSSQVLMTSLLSIIISLILFTVFAMDYPFSGEIKVSPEALELLLDHLK